MTRLPHSRAGGSRMPTVEGRESRGSLLGPGECANEREGQRGGVAGGSGEPTGVAADAVVVVVAVVAGLWMNCQLSKTKKKRRWAGAEVPIFWLAIAHSGHVSTEASSWSRTGPCLLTKTVKRPTAHGRRGCATRAGVKPWPQPHDTTLQKIGRAWPRLPICKPLPHVDFYFFFSLFSSFFPPFTSTGSVRWPGTRGARRCATARFEIVQTNDMFVSKQSHPQPG